MGPPWASRSGEVSCGEAAHPALGGNHEGGVVRAQGVGHGGVFEEPGGEAAELPLGAGVGTGAEEDVEALFLGCA